MRLRRKSSDPSDSTDSTDPDVEQPPGAPATEASYRAQGPWDVDELALVEDDPTRAHLGAISIEGRDGVELRLQVDQASGAVAALLLVAPDGAIELRPFSAARNDDLWAEIRPDIAAEAARQGGRATQVDGPFGPALLLEMPAQTADGQPGIQQSMVVGIAGPRWLLRASLFGRPAVAYDPDAPLEAMMRSTVVVRGDEPMPPGEALPLHLPRNAVPAAEDASTLES